MAGADFLTVGYYSHPPFTDLVGGEVEGVFWQLTQAALTSCLGGGPRLEPRRYRNEDHLLRSGLRECNLSIPVTETPVYSRLSDGAFIPIVSTPGAVWLDPTAGPHQTSVAQLKVVGQAWPLLLIIIISCSFASVLVWFLERLRNPQEFPRPFVRGFWEGWWWAFITMTTVGYGDRSPKTICGRLFAMVWISFGLVLISMFTAGVTTSLSQGAQPEEDSRFFQTNITVINGSFEQILVYELGSTPILINDWKSLLEANFTDSEEAEAPHHGALIEHYMYLHLRQEHRVRLRGVKPQYVLKRPSLRGIYSNLGADANRCLATAMLSQQISVYSSIVGHKHASDDLGSDSQLAEEVAQKLFSTSNVALAVIGAMFVAIFIALLVWEKVYWKPRNPNYNFVERNWKYDRQKKESEFGRQLNLKLLRRSGRQPTGGGSVATTPASAAPPVSCGPMSRPVTIETLRDAAAEAPEETPSGNNGGLGRPKRNWCQDHDVLEIEAEAEAEAEGISEMGPPPVALAEAEEDEEAEALTPMSPM